MHNYSINSEYIPYVKLDYFNEYCRKLVYIDIIDIINRCTIKRYPPKDIHIQ